MSHITGCSGENHCASVVLSTLLFAILLHNLTKSAKATVNYLAPLNHAITVQALTSVFESRKELAAGLFLL